VNKDAASFRKTSGPSPPMAAPSKRNWRIPNRGYITVTRCRAQTRSARRSSNGGTKDLDRAI
jgi:hypothetical protein